MVTAAITPYATLLWATTVFGNDNDLLNDDDFMSMVGRSELCEAGFRNTEIHGVVGGAWLAPNIDELWKDKKSRESLMRSVRLLDMRDDISGLSTHILGISQK